MLLDRASEKLGWMAVLLLMASLRQMPKRMRLPRKHTWMRLTCHCIMTRVCFTFLLLLRNWVCKWVWALRKRAGKIVAGSIHERKSPHLSVLVGHRISARMWKLVNLLAMLPRQIRFLSALSMKKGALCALARKMAAISSLGLLVKPMRRHICTRSSAFLAWDKMTLLF